MTDASPPSRSPKSGRWQSTGRVLRILQGALAVLRRIIDIVAVLLFVYMCCAIFAQIVGRYIFNYSIAWSEESAVFAMVWMTLLGAGIAMRNNQHVGVDFLIRKAPARVQRLFDGIAFLLAAWFLGVVVFGSLSMVGVGMIVKSPALRLPMAVPYLALPVGFGYFLLEFAIASLPRLIRPGRPLQETSA